MVFRLAYLYLEGSSKGSTHQGQYRPLVYPPPPIVGTQTQTPEGTTLKHEAFVDDLGGVCELLELRC